MCRSPLHGYWILLAKAMYIRAKFVFVDVTDYFVPTYGLSFGSVSGIVADGKVCDIDIG